MYLAALIACGISGILILIRIILGKTTFDRVLAINTLGTIIAVSYTHLTLPTILLV
mgnify:CR=1 FL=1